MKWKSKIDRGHGIWSSEVHLKSVGMRRSRKVTKLLNLLEPMEEK